MVHVFAIDGDNLVQKKESKVTGQPFCVAYAPDDGLVAVGTSLRVVLPLNPDTLEEKVS